MRQESCIGTTCINITSTLVVYMMGFPYDTKVILLGSSLRLTFFNIARNIGFNYEVVFNGSEVE